MTNGLRSVLLMNHESTQYRVKNCKQHTGEDLAIMAIKVEVPHNHLYGLRLLELLCILLLFGLLRQRGCLLELLRLLLLPCLLELFFLLGLFGLSELLCLPEILLFFCILELLCFLGLVVALFLLLSLL